ncbi:MAG: hypothetical protein ACYCYO_03845 [Bacilli bacterium]
MRIRFLRVTRIKIPLIPVGVVLLGVSATVLFIPLYSLTQLACLVGASIIGFEASS